VHRSIFQYTCISNKKQRYTIYLYLETALHVSGGTSTHHGWKYHPKHVEQSPDINKLCNVASCWMYIGILLGAHPILHISRIRVKYSTSWFQIIYLKGMPFVISTWNLRNLLWGINFFRQEGFKPHFSMPHLPIRVLINSHLTSEG
jgi:hypothetical protein